jgi:RND family efflux transporter MFP subunit
MKRHTVILLSVVTIAALAAAIAACERRASATPPVATVRAVRVAPVQVVKLGSTLHAVGLLTPKDETRLSFKVTGFVESIRIEEGQAVKAGELLAVLKQTEIGASLEQARQAAAKSERDLARGKALFADGVATVEQVQDLTTAFQVASAAETSAEFNATHARIVAPGAGVVLRKLAEANELVQAGQPVLIVGGAGRGWIVRIGLADRDVVRVRLGDSAQVEFDAWPGQNFAGRVSNMASAADPATGTFTVEVQVEAGTARFVQGLVGKVALNPRDAATGEVVPVQALIEANGNEASVFVLDRAHRVVHRVTVRIGRMNGGQIEIIDGLDPGAEVVIDGAAFLENGETVRIEAGSPAPQRAG